MPTMEQPDKTRSFVTHFLSLLWAVRAIIGIVLLLIAVGSLIFMVEGFGEGRHSFGDALYLAFITALTIGYGDLTPDGPIGRITAVCLGGLGIILTGIVVAAAIKALERAK
jgi:voltage-gated potassium channel